MLKPSLYLITSLTIIFSGCRHHSPYATSKIAWRYMDKATRNEIACNKKEALKDLDTLIILEPNKPEGYYLRAILDTSLKDNDGSIRDINKAITVVPKEDRFLHVVYISFRGDVSRLVGKDSEAIVDYKTAIEICKQALIKNTGNDLAREEKMEIEAKLNAILKQDTVQ